jgi:phospholipase D
MPKVKIKKSTINHLFKFLRFSKTPIRSIIAIFVLGISVGIGYEEMVGIGTWHSLNPDTKNFNVCFTPPSGCGSLIAQEIAKAKSSIYVQAYGLTSLAIIHQLKQAKKRGIRVSVLLDGGNLSDNQEVLLELKAASIEVALDKMPGIAHNKIMIIDRHKVITGSFNFTRAADTRHAENLLLIDDVEVAKIYLQNWFNRKSASHPL